MGDTSAASRGEGTGYSARPLAADRGRRGPSALRGAPGDVREIREARLAHFRTEVQREGGAGGDSGRPDSGRSIWEIAAELEGKARTRPTVPIQGKVEPRQRAAILADHYAKVASAEEGVNPWDGVDAVLARLPPSTTHPTGAPFHADELEAAIAECAP